MKDNTTAITLESVVSTAQRMKSDGYRLVTMSCAEVGDNVDVLYHFDKDLDLKNFRLTVPKGTRIPSISSVLFMALLVENEMQDLFGLCFDGLVLDFGGRLYRQDEAQSRPFCKVSVSQAS